jgi:hypothetical protein
MYGKFTTGPSSPQLTTFPINPLTSLSDRFHNNTTGQYFISQSVGGYLSELNRPLDEKDSIKLFATNGLVDKYNRQCILQAEGQLYEYRAEDGGDVQHLSKVLAPPTLWLKKYCPVV